MSTLELISLTIFYVMLGIECLVFIPFSIKYKKLDRGSTFVYYYLASSILLAAGSILCRYLNHNNMWLFSIMHYLQFLFISLFYWQIIQNIKIKKVVEIGIFALLFIGLSDFFFLEGRYFFNSISVSIRNVVLLAYGFVFFFQLIKDEKLIHESIYINSLPSFWYNAGIFIYTCSSFMFCLSANYLQGVSIEEQNKFFIVLDFNYLAGIIQIILFYFGFKNIKNDKKVYY